MPSAKRQGTRRVESKLKYSALNPILIFFKIQYEYIALDTLRVRNIATFVTIREGDGEERHCCFLTASFVLHCVKTKYFLKGL